MEIKEYTEKSFVVLGETKNHKDTLKELGGKSNANLKVGPGWIFSNNHKEKVETWLNDMSSTQSRPTISHKMDSSFIDSLVDEFVEKLSKDEDNIDVIDINKMCEYKNNFFEFLINRDEFMSFSEYLKIDTDKFLEFSIIKHLRKQYK